MANEKRRLPFFLRPLFLLFVLYVIVYVGLRHREEMVVQAISLPSMRGGAYNAVTPNPRLPFWRQQIWRACFSFLMVIEEEGRKAAAMGQGLVGNATGYATGNGGVPAGNYAQPQPSPARNTPASPSDVRSTDQIIDGLVDNSYKVTGPRNVYAAPPGGVPTDQVIDNWMENRQMLEKATSGAPQGLAPGEQLLYVAPPGEGVPGMTMDKNKR